MFRLIIRRLLGFILMASAVILFCLGVLTLFTRNLYGLVIFGLTSATLFYLARRLATGSIERKLSRSDRAPVFYLRSFLSDQTAFGASFLRTWLAPFRFGMPETDEEALARLLGHAGSFVAIGNPGEWLPKLGAARIYRGNDEWQVTVLDLLRRARLVVVRVGDTEGLHWELNAIRELVSPRNLIIWHPLPGRLGSHRRWRSSYQIFRSFVDPMFPEPLPADLGRAEFVFFDDAWKPRISSETRINMWDWIRGFMGRSRGHRLSRQLRPELAMSGLYIPLLRPRPVEVINFIFYGVLLGMVGLAMYRPDLFILTMMFVQGHIVLRDGAPHGSCGEMSRERCQEYFKDMLHAMSDKTGYEAWTLSIALLLRGLIIMTFASLAFGIILRTAMLTVRTVTVGVRRLGRMAKLSWKG